MTTHQRAPRDDGANAILTYIGLTILTIAAGLALRLAPLGWPYWLTKWGGSVLWASMVYWIVALAMPFRRVWVIAAIASGVAGVVEALRLYHSPGLDAFRLTLAGALLLGRVFSGWHLLAYWLAIPVAAGIDYGLLRRRRPQ